MATSLWDSVAASECAGAAQRGDAESVAAVHPDLLAAVGGDLHRVVGLGAVEIQHHRIDVGP